jgi:hypothetical protein
VAWAGLDDRLVVEVVKSRDLEWELTDVKDTLQKESDEHDTLRVTIRVVCDDLKLSLAQETSSLVVHVT